MSLAVGENLRVGWPKEFFRGCRGRGQEGVKKFPAEQKHFTQGRKVAKDAKKGVAQSYFSPRKITLRYATRVTNRRGGVPMQLGRKIVKGFMLVVFACSLLWSATLLAGLADIYLFRDVPWKTFSNWAVDMQVREYLPGLSPHSRSYYIARFYTETALVLCTGVLSAIYYKRIPWHRDQSR